MTGERTEEDHFLDIDDGQLHLSDRTSKCELKPGRALE